MRKPPDNWDKPFHYPGYDGLKGGLSTTELILIIIACMLCASLLLALPVEPITLVGHSPEGEGSW